jgi:hypothetical protein
MLLLPAASMRISFGLLLLLFASAASACKLRI